MYLFSGEPTTELSSTAQPSTPGNKQTPTSSASEADRSGSSSPVIGILVPLFLIAILLGIFAAWRYKRNQHMTPNIQRFSPNEIRLQPRPTEPENEDGKKHEDLIYVELDFSHLKPSAEIQKPKRNSLIVKEDTEYAEIVGCITNGGESKNA